MKSPSPGFRVRSDWNLAQRRRSRLLVECHPGRRVLVREHQPERGPVPSTSILGNARRSRSLRCSLIRSASVSGYGPAARSSSQRPREHREIAEPIEKPGEAAAFGHVSEISSADRWCRRSMDAGQCSRRAENAPTDGLNMN